VGTAGFRLSQNQSVIFQISSQTRTHVCPKSALSGQNNAQIKPANIPLHWVLNCLKPALLVKKWKQDTQRTYNVTMRHVHETIVVEKQYALHILSVCVCVCVRAWCMGCGCTDADVCLRASSLAYPACNTHAPCCLRPLWLHHIFRHFLINGTNFGGEKKVNIKCVLIFSTTSILTIYHCKKNSAKYCHKCENGF
jgi:hypothetical protein